MTPYAGPCSRRTREHPQAPAFPVSSPSDASNSGMLPRLGDLLFYTIAEGQERIPIHKFTKVSGYLPV